MTELKLRTFEWCASGQERDRFMKPNQVPDESLMAQVAKGRRDQLEPLVRRYASPLLTFIRRMIGDQHRSEELFQEVFLAVWTKRQQYQLPRPFKAWLYAIALNKCRAAVRGWAGPMAWPLEDDSPVVPTAPEPSPADIAIATETAALVSTAVHRLPPQQRAVVVLRIWDGLSYAEIADIVGRAEGTVRSNMYHGLAALRNYLEPRLG
jgi:RNA polymerase sigma-70 factor (ECF subfamily)